MARSNFSDSAIEVDTMPSITSQCSTDGALVTIKVTGRFDFTLHKAFRDAYREYDSGRVKFVVDMSRVEYLDSSALGMLLLLREHVGGDKGRVLIRNANAAVDKILRVANFDKLFGFAGSGAALAG